MKQELVALTVQLLIFVGLPASLFGYQTWRTNMPDASGVRIVELVGHAPGSGGWQPNTIRVNVGDHVLLRISSPDVIHGLAVPELGINVDEILPGHVETVEFTALQAGRFPFACTRWCSPDHWRMRGYIEVVDPKSPNPPPPALTPPLFQQLHIDIDSLHPAANVPAERPSAARGAILQLRIAQDLRTSSPSEVFARLRNDPTFRLHSDSQMWDAIAFAFKQTAGDDAIKRGEKLYERDCAACHGETGKGNGAAGVSLPGMAAMRTPTPDGGHTGMPVKHGPANFTDAAQMLGASDVLLQGKILRGGMGTGMPEWGSLYTERDMLDVISFIRSFTFDYADSHESK